MTTKRDASGAMRTGLSGRAGVQDAAGRAGRGRKKQGKRRKPAKAASDVPCQVLGCTDVIPGSKSYYRRYRVCLTHSKQLEVEVDGAAQRFCQQHGCFHPLDEFRGTQRSCTAALARHRSRRAVHRQLSTTAADDEDACDGAAAPAVRAEEDSEETETETEGEEDEEMETEVMAEVAAEDGKADKAEEGAIEQQEPAVDPGTSAAGLSVIAPARPYKAGALPAATCTAAVGPVTPRLRVTPSPGSHSSAGLSPAGSLVRLLSKQHSLQAGSRPMPDAAGVLSCGDMLDGESRHPSAAVSLGTNPSTPLLSAASEAQLLQSLAPRGGWGPAPAAEYTPASAAPSIDQLFLASMSSAACSASQETMPAHLLPAVPAQALPAGGLLASPPVPASASGAAAPLTWSQLAPLQQDPAVPADPPPAAQACPAWLATVEVVQQRAVPVLPSRVLPDMPPSPFMGGPCRLSPLPLPPSPALPFHAALPVAGQQYPGIAASQLSELDLLQLASPGQQEPASTAAVRSPFQLTAAPSPFQITAAPSPFQLAADGFDRALGASCLDSGSIFDDALFDAADLLPLCDKADLERLAKGLD